jgi:hypothetical protein
MGAIACTILHKSKLKLPNPLCQGYRVFWVLGIYNYQFRVKVLVKSPRLGEVGIAMSS